MECAECTEPIKSDFDYHVGDKFYREGGIGEVYAHDLPDWYDHYSYKFRTRVAPDWKLYGDVEIDLPKCLRTADRIAEFEAMVKSELSFKVFDAMEQAGCIHTPEPGAANVVVRIAYSENTKVCPSTLGGELPDGLYYGQWALMDSPEGTTKYHRYIMVRCTGEYEGAQDKVAGAETVEKLNESHYNYERDIHYHDTVTAQLFADAESEYTATFKKAWQSSAKANAADSETR